MKHNPTKKKAFVPTGKSAIRQAILKVLQNGNKSLAKDTSNVTLKHIEQYLGNFPELFSPSALQSGAKFIRDIRDKSTDEEGAKLFKKGGQKYKTLLRFAEMLEFLKQPSKEYRSPQARYTRQAEQASKVAVRDIEDKVMGQISTLYMVILYEGNDKERILGGFASAPSARAAARAYMTGIKKAYDPLIPLYTSRETKTGRTSSTRSKLKINVKYITHQVKGKDKRTGEAVYSFENDGAYKYLKDKLGKRPITVRVRLITHKEDHKAYWKLFNSPAVGQLRWNPKR
tara:strand:+ start:745 stop:1602 length:858 start_codon:yes stop_codon:yes gene_type:complete